MLLFQAAAGPDDGTPIMVCEEGIVFRDVLVDDPETHIRVRSRNILRGGGHELAIGGQTLKFRGDPSLLAKRLQGWASFLFDEFLPRARLIGRRRSPEGDRLIGQTTVTCSECSMSFLGLAGEIGLAAVPTANEDVE